jgi:hypothetical protein
VPEEWYAKIFPWIETWRYQVHHLHLFDKGDGANIFVMDLLPFVATFILQEGVLLINEYPDHLHSKILLDKVKDCVCEQLASDTRMSIATQQLVKDWNILENSRYEAMVQIINLSSIVHELKEKIENHTSRNIISEHFF